MADTRWLNTMNCRKISKSKNKIKPSSNWVFLWNHVLFQSKGNVIFRPCHWSKALGPSPHFPGQHGWSWPSWPLPAPGQPLRSLATPRKHYAHGEGWVALGNNVCDFWASFGSRQNAPGPTLATKNVTGCTAWNPFATRRCLFKWATNT